MWDALCKEIKEQSCTSFHGHDRNVSHGGESLAIRGTEFGPWFFTSHPRSFLLQSMWRTLWSPLWCKSSHVAEQPAPTHQPSTSLFESPLCMTVWQWYIIYPYWYYWNYWDILGRLIAIKRQDWTCSICFKCFPTWKYSVVCFPAWKYSVVWVY